NNSISGSIIRNLYDCRIKKIVAIESKIFLVNLKQNNGHW
ncbi:MAG: hypothetical protein ACJAZG_002024, partial [Granulosicoccus sp.]